MCTKTIRISTKAKTTSNGYLRITTSVSNGSTTRTKTKTIRLK